MFKVLCFPDSNKEDWVVKSGALGWERSSPWTQGRSLQSEYQNRGLESETKDPRRGGKGETPAGKSSGTRAEASQQQARTQASGQENQPRGTGTRQAEPWAITANHRAATTK